MGGSENSGAGGENTNGDGFGDDAQDGVSGGDAFEGDDGVEGDSGGGVGLVAGEGDAAAGVETGFEGVEDAGVAVGGGGVEEGDAGVGVQVGGGGGVGGGQAGLFGCGVCCCGDVGVFERGEGVGEEG